MQGIVQLSSADGFEFPVYVARPLTPLPNPLRGAIVVLQEIFGVNSHIRAVADSYAAAGYVALAPAMFHRVQVGVELGYTQADIAAGVALKASVECLPLPGVLQDLQATVDYAQQFGKVGVVGFCWGGLLTWRAACLLQGIDAAVPYYGGGMTQPAEAARQPRCPVLAHFGEQDHAIPIEGVRAFERLQREAHADALATPAKAVVVSGTKGTPTTLQASVQVQVYAAQHGFNCDQRASFDAAAAATARERTLAFFAQHLARG